MKYKGFWLFDFLGKDRKMLIIPKLERYKECIQNCEYLYTCQCLFSDFAVIFIHCRNMKNEVNTKNKIA